MDYKDQLKLAIEALPSFGRHETFPLRFGWIPKGLLGFAANHSPFARREIREFTF